MLDLSESLVSEMFDIHTRVLPNIRPMHLRCRNIRYWNAELVGSILSPG